MDVVDDDDSRTKPSSSPRQHSPTATDAPPHLSTALLQCHTAPPPPPPPAGGRRGGGVGGGEVQPPPSLPTEPAFGGDDGVVISGEFSEAVDAGTSMGNRDEVAEGVEERDAFVGEVAGKTAAVVAPLGFEEAGLAVKSEGIETADLNVSNVLEEEIVEESVAWRVGDAEKKGSASGSGVDAMCGVGVEDEIMEGNDGVDEKEVAVETGKVEEEGDEDAMPVKTEEAEERVVGMERVDAGVDGTGVEDEVKEGSDEVEVNVVGTVDGTTDADGTGSEEVAEEREVGNEADLVEEEEEDAAGIAQYTEAAEEMDVANEADLVKEEEEEEKADAAGIAEDTEAAEEREVANEPDLVEEEEEEEEEEADAAGMAQDTEAAEEMEVANEADLVEEEEEADAAGIARDTEATEEMEVAEEQSRSVSGGKRKRGKNSKATGRVPSRKKMEEDVCFICFDGGELVLCDRR